MNNQDIDRNSSPETKLTHSEMIEKRSVFVMDVGLIGTSCLATVKLAGYLSEGIGEYTDSLPTGKALAVLGTMAVLGAVSSLASDETM